MFEKFKYVYRVETISQSNLIETKPEKIILMNEPGHISKVNGYALCGIDVTKIGKEVTTRTKVIAGSTICQACQEAWKKDPDSPYTKWIKATQR